MTLEDVIAVALASRRGMSQLRRAVTSDLVVANPWYLQCTAWAADFVDRHGDVPRPGDAAAWIDSAPEQSREALRSAWSRLTSRDLSSFTHDHVAEVAVEELRRVATKNALARMQGESDPDVLRDMARRVDDIRTVSIDGLADIRDVDLWCRPPNVDDERVPTGVTRVDERLGGGIGRELTFMLGATGGGKTTWLCNRGRAAALHGKVALHVTLELSKELSIHRYYRAIAEADKGEFRTGIADVRHRVHHWFRFAGGTVYVLYLPAYGPTVEDIRAVVETFMDVHGELHVLVLDYMDLLARTRDQSRLQGWDQLGRMAHELRTMCVDPGIEVTTAAQATREGLDADDLKMKHMAGSVEKLRAADVVLGMAATEEERQLHQARIRAMKARDHAGGWEVPVMMDLDIMKIVDLDHPDALRRRVAA